MDYKSTLNLPKTAFPMKGNLPQSEPKMLERWEQEGLYARIQEDRKGASPFILHDGPPYANGDIHIGHALNKILKDIIVRFETMRGKRSPYVPGWDCHGLPIEYALMKELKVTKHQVETAEFRKKARDYARKYVGIQREQFKRLEVMGDWENPYLTLEPGYVAAALRALAELTRKGFVYRARKPVNWCWSCETALAEAEVEYEDHESPAIFVKFELTPDSVKRLKAHFTTSSSRKRGSGLPLSDSRSPLGGGDMFRGNDRRVMKGALKLPSDRDINRVFLIIWTTTPWTLMGNVAVAVHPALRYMIRAAGMKQDGKRVHDAWITLSQPPAAYTDMFRMHMRDEKEDILLELDGKQLEGLEYEHPFGIRKGRVVLANYVSSEEGTGLVHTAPGFGTEDYVTGKRYGLEVLAPVDAQGRFTGLPKEVASFNGLHVQREASKRIIEELKPSGIIPHWGQYGYKHQYPHCWRCHNPIIFRATDQWFLKIEHEGLRDRLLQAVDKEVKWTPSFGRERMTGMIKTRPDWCLSRQRLWGIPIPAVTCASCGEGTLEPEVIEKFAAAVEKDPEGSDRWFTDPVSSWLPDNYSCKCGSNQFDPGADILDVWFDSGVSHRGVLKRRSELVYPADLYLEGSDQHRGWFQVSLITGTALDGRPPYKGVLTHGFVVDGDGRKMSKSLGNVVAPQEVISKMGAEVLRLWVAGADYAEDVRISPVILEQVSETYRKVRNTVRYLLANVSDFPPEEQAGAAQNARGMDRWLLCELHKLTVEVTTAYEEFAFHKVVKAVHEFCTVKLSNFYLDVVKDPLYTCHPKDPRRLSIQRALWVTARTLVRLLAPVLPVTAEEAWGALGGQIGTGYVPGPEGGSVHRVPWPEIEELPVDGQLQLKWGRLLLWRDEVMKKLEEKRAAGLIGEALEAELEIAVRDPVVLKLFEESREEFAAACIVSGISVRKGEGNGPDPDIQVKKANGVKCQRCWKRLAGVGESAEHPTLCAPCVGVLQKLEVGGKL